MIEQRDVMIQQANVSQRQFEITDRPWLFVEVVPNGPLMLGREGATVFVRYNIKNVGRSVATNVTIKSTALMISVLEPYQTEPVKRQKARCAETQTPDSPTTMTVFPNDTKSNVASLTIRSEVPEFYGVSSGVVSLILVGCVDYVSGDSVTHHQTGFISEILDSDPTKDPPNPISLRIGEKTVPMNRVMFGRYYFGGDYAY